MSDQATNAQPLSRRELEEKIIARAWTDDEFRRKFVADPKGQFEAHLGTTLPNSLKMKVHEETPDSLHFVIPQKPVENLDELSEEDLEKVAGGIDVFITAAVIATVTGAGAISGMIVAATNKNDIDAGRWK